jgi:hypothetical protein
VELFSDEEEVVVAADAATPVTGDALVFICRLAGTFSFLRSTTGPGRYEWENSRSTKADARALGSGQLIRPKDDLLPEGTPAKWQEGPGGCKEAGLSTKTVIRGEWEDCSVWEWIGW